MFYKHFNKMTTLDDINPDNELWVSQVRSRLQSAAEMIDELLSIKSKLKPGSFEKPEDYSNQIKAFDARIDKLRQTRRDYIYQLRSHGYYE